MIEVFPPGTLFDQYLYLVDRDPYSSPMVAKTVEVVPGRVMIDYAEDGSIIGVEVLGVVTSRSDPRLPPE